MVSLTTARSQQQRPLTFITMGKFVQRVLLCMILAAAAAAGVSHVHAYPMYFHNKGFANSCTDAPTFDIAGHQTPVPDP